MVLRLTARPLAAAPARPVATVAAAARRHRHAGAVRRGRERARLLPHAAVRGGPVREQGALGRERRPGGAQHRPPVPGVQGPAVGVDQQRPVRISPTSLRRRPRDPASARPTARRARRSRSGSSCGPATSLTRRSPAASRWASTGYRSCRKSSCTRSTRSPRTAGWSTLWTRMPVGKSSVPVPGLLVGAKFGTRVRAVLLLPADGRAADDRVDSAHAAAGRDRRRVPAGRDRLAGHPVGGRPGPAGRARRLAAVDRAPERADGGARHRRAGRAGHLVQRDGGQPAGEARRSSRTCPRCSASSSPTCRTSCAPR